MKKPEPDPEPESASSESEESPSSVSGSAPKIAAVAPAVYSVAALLEKEPEEPEFGRRFTGFSGSARVASGGDRSDNKITTPPEEPRYNPTSTKLLNVSKPPPIPAGVANKEFRKSALNVDLEEQQVAEFRKRQEEIREAQRLAKRFAKKSPKGSDLFFPTFSPNRIH